MMRILAVLMLLGLAATAHAKPFVIDVVDDQTGRGVPLVELCTTANVCYVTDSAGTVALDEPGLVGQKVWFTITSFGYEFPADGLGSHGTAIEITSGGSARLTIKRVNIAQRMYRMTGEGIYRDSVLAGRTPPIKEPLLNAQVSGQDSVQSVVYRDKIYFFWGDTGRIGYPLGNFNTTGAIATSSNPARGIDLEYFKDDKGFTKKMAPLKEPGPVWLGALMTLADHQGQERMLASFTRVKDLGTRLESGLMIFNDQTQTFERFQPIALDAIIAPGGHPFRAKVDGQDYIYFPTPYPAIRVKADWKMVGDLSQYEALTPLKQGTRYSKDKLQLEGGFT